MIRFASDGDLEQSKELWQQIFGDTQQAIDLYFSDCYRPSNLLVDVEDGKVCAMLTLLPIRLGCGGQSYEGRYIYAVATREDERGQGRSTRLLERAHSVMKEQGVAASILVPASESLFSFYQKRGYQRAFQLNKQSFTAAEIQKNTACRHEFSICGAEQYFRIRQRVFSKHTPFAEWDLAMLDFAMRFARLYESEFYHIRTLEGEAVAYCCRHADRIVVKEAAIWNLRREEVLSVLHAHLNAQHYEIFSAPSGEYGANLDFAMIRPFVPDVLPSGTPYFNLAMD